MKDPTTLDMLELARFAALPGAARLVNAFAVIPPGPLRDSVITHAEVIAQTYASAPVEHRMPDPIALLSADPPRAAPVASRTGKAPPTESPDAMAVKLRLEGLPIPEISRRTGLTAQAIYQAVGRARKAGLAFTRAKGETDVQPKAWPTSIAEVSQQGFHRFARAAADRGLTPEQFIERRQLALKMAMEGADYQTIMQATREPKSSTIGGWLYLARTAGYDVPYVRTQNAGPEDESEQPDDGPALRRAAHRNESDGPRWAVTVDDLTPTGLRQVKDAADARGVTAEAYLERRQLALKMAMEGRPYDAILRATGETDRKVLSAWISKARSCGYDVPYIRQSEAAEGEASAYPAPQNVPETDTAAQVQSAPTPEPQTERKRVFPAPEALTKGARTMAERAATARGMTLAAYQDMRESVVRHRLDGKGTGQIVSLTGQGKQFIKDVLADAVHKGVRFPELAAEAPPAASPEPVTAPAPAPVAEAPALEPWKPGDRVFSAVTKMHPTAAVTVYKAATARGLSVHEYEDVRESIVLHRLDGKGTTRIAELINQDKKFVQNTLSQAVAKGVVFPPIAEDDGPIIELAPEQARAAE